jgi:hypothetical protein
MNNAPLLCENGLVAVSAKAIEHRTGLSPSKNTCTAKIAAAFLADVCRQVAGSGSTVFYFARSSRAETLLGCLVSLHLWHGLIQSLKLPPTIGAKLGR